MSFAFQQSPARPGKRVALFPGAFNPPTIAHAAIAHAALEWADHVIWVLPTQLPHKQYEGVSFEDRLEMLRVLTDTQPRFQYAVTEGGLYIEMARQAKDALDAGTEIALVCGRDAAERIAGWDYGREGVFEEMVAEFPLLVAARAGTYEPPLNYLGDRIVPLKMESSFDDISSTEIRSLILARQPWKHFVPKPLHDAVERHYT